MNVIEEFNQWGDLWRTEMEVRNQLKEEAELQRLCPERLKKQRQQIMSVIMALADQEPSPTYSKTRALQALHRDLHL